MLAVRSSGKLRALAGGTALIAIGWAVPGWAQTPTEAATSAPAAGQVAQTSTEEGGLADIIVTAQKRSESLQKTPLAISAVSAETIATRRIEDATQLNSVAPSLSVTTSPSNRGHLVIFIRGIGESDPVLTNDSPVGVYVDGVILGRSTASVFELVDLDRIEVLRGPQGTLYGRNTTGGAVNLITKKPSDTFGVDVRGSYGNRNYFQGRGSIDTGLIGGTGFKAKLSYVHKQADGYVDNLDVGGRHDPGAYNTDAFRGVLAYDDGGPFRATYTFDYAQTKAVPALSQLVAVGPNQLAYFSQSPAFGGTAFIPPSTSRLGQARPDVTSSYDRNISNTVTLEYDVSDKLTIRSLTGFRQWRNHIYDTDIDGNSGLRGLVVSPAFSFSAPVQLFGADSFRRQHQFSQEVNLIGSIGDKIDYVVGGYYFKEKAHELNPQRFTVVLDIPLAEGAPPTLVGANVVSTLNYGDTNESKAAFGQATYHFTDKLSFTGGLRYTKDNKTLTQVSPFDRRLSRSFDRVNGAATLQYQITPDIMTYARYATGYKAGGFNARNVDNGYDPESVRSYEVGAKTELFDRRLRLNGTLFLMNLKDLQVSQFQAGANGAVSETVNAGKTRYKGIELEFDALPIDALRLNGAVGYTDRNYREITALDPSTNTLSDFSSTARFAYSPSTTYNIGAEYTIKNVLTGDLSFRLDYAYKSKVTFDVFPTLAPFSAYTGAPGYGLLDGRIQLAAVPLRGGEASVSLWGKNLTNKIYRTGSIDFGSALGFAVSAYGETRSYGVDLRYKF